MGVFFFIRSVALVEDLPLDEHYRSPQEFYAAADLAYQQVCFQWVSGSPANSRFLAECHQLLDRHCFVHPHPDRISTTILCE